ncbi:MAG: hypothetical protein PUB43_04060 [Oscillospiraceae bacterium]|nr:hypothetical protein [Oscillospiraceae bacterium]
MSKLIAIINAIIIFLEVLPMAGTPTLHIDASAPLGAVTTKATGFLYGLAQQGVPSEAVTNSIDISSVSQKVPGGLQHPTGDAENVMSQLNECDYVVVYLQDCFDTWYYCHDEIMKLRAEGKYDWREFLREKYLPIVEEKVRYIESQPYRDKIVYCIYNECDNAVWFGSYLDGSVHYNDEGKANFYEAWKITYDLVKSIAPEAKIGGPGFCDYVTDKIEGFMAYCAENACLPQIMIYHELNPWSIPDWETHVADYRRIEKEVGADELPIIVTEYGCMEDCGEPTAMFQYINAIENTGTWANMAFWRLANNLNDTCADDNSPNSNWWLYRKYAELDGQRLQTEVKALKKSMLYDSDWRLTYQGLAVLSEEKDSINIICTGSQNKRSIVINNLDSTNLGDKVTVKVEAVYYSGLGGIVSSPTVIRQFSIKPTSGKLRMTIPGTDTNAVYFVSIIPYDENAETIVNRNIPKRYEFESGKLLGESYTYDSAYASTGEQKGLVGGFEKEGDGVRLTFSVPSCGKYDLKIIYGKGNDTWGKPQERDYAVAKMSLDGKEETLSLENTIKSEYTSLKTITAELSTGLHTIELSHGAGTFVLDSMIVAPHSDSREISVLPDSKDGSAYLAVADTDGFYDLTTDACGEATLDGAKFTIKENGTVYLRRGLNEIRFAGKAEFCRLTKSEKQDFRQVIKAGEISLEGKAQLLTDKYGTEYVGNISSLGGSGKFTVQVPEDGDYRFTVLYACNSEGGVHAYNVDLIEDYLTVTCGDKSTDIFCRNTYSKFTYKTVTFHLSLRQGDNEITLSNSGNTVFNGMEAFAPQIAEITVNAAG